MITSFTLVTKVSIHLDFLTITKLLNFYFILFFPNETTADIYYCTAGRCWHPLQLQYLNAKESNV